MSQVEKILRHIEMYGSITPLEAMQEYGIMRLASRMCDIKRAGYKVQSTTETSENRNGEKVRYSRYTIPVNIEKEYRV